MSGKKFYTQIDMRVQPTSEEHVVRLGDMIEYVTGKIKNPVRVLLKSNFEGTYNAASKILIQDTAEVIVIDGVTVALGDRVLLTGQTDATQNGIYTVTTLGTSSVEGALTRAEDFDETADIVHAVKVPITEGTEFHDVTYVLATEPPYTLDTTDLQFVMDSGPVQRVIDKVFNIVGDGTTTEFNFNHGLNTFNMITQLFEETSGEVVEALVWRDNADVKVTFGDPPGVGENFLLVIHAYI